MSLQKFLQTIENIDPGKIYVENVRSILKINRFSAKVICEMAVRDNLFVKKIGVVCKNSDCRRIIDSYDSYEDIPKTITCEICEELEKDKYQWNTSELEKIEYYELNKSDGD